MTTQMPSREVSNNASPIPPASMARLWLRMGEIFGAERWSKNYGDDPGKGAAVTWAKGLAGLSDQQIAVGVSAVVRGAEPWLPTLPDFRAHCLSIPSLAEVRLDMRKEVGQRKPFSVLVWQNLDGFRFRNASVDLATKSRARQ